MNTVTILLQQEKDQNTVCTQLPQLRAICTVTNANHTYIYLLVSDLATSRFFLFFFSFFFFFWLTVLHMHSFVIFKLYLLTLLQVRELKVSTDMVV